MRCHYTGDMQSKLIERGIQGKEGGKQKKLLLSLKITIIIRRKIKF